MTAENTTVEARPEPAQVEAFTNRLVTMLNDSAIALGIGLGHRTGLFDTMAGLGPATSAEIARAGGLVERYVREWLGAMTVGRIVTYDPKTATYRLPPEHAAALTRRVGPDNMAMFMQYVALLGTVEPLIFECFQRGGGVPYSAYPRFHEVQAEESSIVKVPFVLERTLPLVPGLDARLESGIDVADIGCGAGRVLLRLAEAFPRSRFVGFDLSAEAVEMGQAGAEAQRLANIRFVVRDVAELGEERAFDFVTAFDTIHDQAQPSAVLAGIARALRADGTFLMVDIAGSSRLEENLEHPMAPFFYTASVFHCMAVSLEQGGEGLGTMWGEHKARELLAQAGFAHVEVKRIDTDPFDAYYVARLGS